MNMDIAEMLDNATVKEFETALFTSLKTEVIRLETELENAKRKESERAISANEKFAEFENRLKFNTDVRIKDLEDKLKRAEQDLAVANKEIEMTKKLVDLNADVLDVKDIVNKLFAKLPEIKFAVTPVMGQQQGGGDKNQNKGNNNQNQGGGDKGGKKEE
jgi:hypothetical protein